MRVCCISDTHGNVIPNIEPCDLLVHAGDGVESSLSNHRDSIETSERKRSKFAEMMLATDADRVIYVPGNHDGIFEELSITQQHIGKLSIVSTGSLTINVHNVKWKVSTLSYTPTFGDWHYMVPPEEMGKLAAKIPKDTDILVTHGPAFGILDETHPDSHAGCSQLLKRIADLPNLKLHVCGHIHRAYGIKDMRRYWAVNAALSNNWNILVNNPIYIDIDKEI